MTRLIAGTAGPKAYSSTEKYLPVVATLAVLVLMFAIGSFRYPGFLSGQVMLNLLVDNAYLIVVAVGMTYVILTGGIDLSVGSTMALSAMVSAVLLERHGWPPMIVVLLTLTIGTVFGLGMGWVIHAYQIQPFIVTLVGMFLARGLTFTISTDAITVTGPFYVTMAQTRIQLPGGLFVSISVLVALAIVAVAFYTLHYTRLGRNVYAIGGNEQSAVLMGLPVGRTKITAYAISGFCAALAGLLFLFYTGSGYSLHAVGMELEAIAAVVIGGTLLTGGSGFVVGTLLGCLVLGLIQTIIAFQGTLSAWWTKIVIGVLLLAFILLQKVIADRKT